MRNIKISNAVIGISQIWNWGWTYSGLSISNCGTAFSMSNMDGGKLLVGSVVIIDSQISNCQKFVDMVRQSCLNITVMCFETDETALKHTEK